MDELTLRRREEDARWSSVYGRKFRVRGQGSKDGGNGETSAIYNDDDDVEEDGTSKRGRNRNSSRSSRRSRVKTLRTAEDDDDDGTSTSPPPPPPPSTTMMSADEISAFESQYGIRYDPYTMNRIWNRNYQMESIRWINPTAIDDMRMERYSIKVKALDIIIEWEVVRARRNFGIGEQKFNCVDNIGYT